MKKIIAALLSVVLLLALASCGSPDKPSKQNPVSITVWHTYVEDMQNAFNALIEEFNNTLGAENGITVKVTAVNDARVINEYLLAAADDDPGALELPDIALVYPVVAAVLAEKGALADLSGYFSQTELDEFVPQFIEEGRLGTESLYIVPVAKSTEVLYVNRTHFDRFSSETGVGIDILSTFEGIAEAAMLYYGWTDSKTPDTPNDGKMFFYPEGLFNQAMIGFQQLGGDIVEGDALNLSDRIYKRIWDCYYAPAVKGGTIIYDGWSNYLASTGDVVCAIATSAGSSFYPSSITHADNTKEDVVFDVLPYPVFEGGESVSFQRGGGFCVTKSEPIREYAAYLFLDWFTEAEQNLVFCANTGYMPVRKNAFDEILAGNLPVIDNPMVEKALLTVAAMQNSYRFYFPPVFDGFDSLQTRYAERLRSAAQSSRDEYLQLLETLDEDDAFNEVSSGAMDEYIGQFIP